MAEGFMTSIDVCRYCGFSPTVLNRLEQSGVLKPRRVLPTNNRRLYVKEDVEAYLDTVLTSRKS